MMGMRLVRASYVDERTEVPESTDPEGCHGSKAVAAKPETGVVAAPAKDTSDESLSDSEKHT